MKNYLNTIRFHSKKIISGEYENSVLQELNGLEGVEGLHFGLDFVEVDYYPQLESPASLKDALSRASFDFQKLPAKRNQGLFSNLISNLAKENKKTYGRKGPSCCR
jgi:hypothetical protein